MMKQIPSLVLLLVVLFATNGLYAQDVNYQNLEKRFVKKELTSADTIAFRKVGEQKVRQLLDETSFYTQNYSNTSNQMYVKQQIPDYFYVPPGDSLDVDALLDKIERAKRSQSKSIELQTLSAPGYLGLVKTLNCDPSFTFYLVLMQISKQFGKEQEMVWQVFLQNPSGQNSNKNSTPNKKMESKSGR